MLVFVLIVYLASALLLGWLTVILPRTSFELRVPKALAAVRAGAPLLGSRGSADPAVGDGDPPGPAERDVELAVRERLYGPRPDRR